jgi:ectoine hydroxylase-related dioxygenase (phytanoyl-CoA dioxygenase family)
VSKGGILIFDSLAFHSVGKNKSSDTRMSIAGGYTSTDELVPLEDDTLREIVRGERLYRGSINLEN